MRLNNHIRGLDDAIARGLDGYAADKVIDRIWARDHTLWSDDPAEISNRLGWLDSPIEMRGNIAEIISFANSIQREGIENVVLLGMGGSSLAPELFAKSFDPPGKFPEFHVMDSTHPDAVLTLARRLEPKTTILLVATKSGGTVETLSLFKYFYNWIMDGVGAGEAGNHFAAITDPGSALEAMAGNYAFRKTFLNNPNIGGRYSALSFFGLVPAAIVGVDIARVLQRAEEAAAQCLPEVEVRDNPAAILGAFMAEAAKIGRDKLVFKTSPQIASFGDWVEQLIAESTGKGGHGILPVVGEALSDNRIEKEDQAHVFMRTANKNETGINGNENPMIEIVLEDVYDLGGQFFIWEMATAMAGYGLKIHPFNQPNVEAAKAVARELISAQRENVDAAEKDLPEATSEKIGEFLDQAEPGDYIAIQAYLPPSNATWQSLADLRMKLMARTGIVTTVGYGPRYLHSTGQLHKGDAGKGTFIQLVGEPEEDVAIPDTAGETSSSLTFGELMRAQALGDASALHQGERNVITTSISGNIPKVIKTITKGL